MNDYLLITCEHGGNNIPARYADLFRDYSDLLQTHRGYDAGALLMARELAQEFAAPLVASTVNRLLIDLNRSIGHPHLYSDATRHLAKKVREDIVRDHYRPYRNKAEGLVQRAVGEGKKVIHVSSHSFTPELNGEVRDADIGLLFNPGRAFESLLAQRWQGAFKTLAPGLKVRRNYPYAGKADGLTSFLRRRHSPVQYVGIELEINQKHVAARPHWRELRKLVAAALRRALAE